MRHDPTDSTDRQDFIFRMLVVHRECREACTSRTYVGEHDQSGWWGRLALGAPHQHEVLIVHRPTARTGCSRRDERASASSALECALRGPGGDRAVLHGGREAPRGPLHRPTRTRQTHLGTGRCNPSVVKFCPNDEVDEVRWMPLRRAGEMLTSRTRHRRGLVPPSHGAPRSPEHVREPTPWATVSSVAVASAATVRT